MNNFFYNILKKTEILIFFDIIQSLGMCKNHNTPLQKESL